MAITLLRALITLLIGTSILIVVGDLLTCATLEELRLRAGKMWGQVSRVWGLGFRV